MNRSSPSLWMPLKLRDFRALWLGYSAFMLGNQFYFVALTWLLLKFTDSGVLLGSVLLVGAIPRALFMLVGGVLVDRFTPRPILRWFSIAVTAIVAGLTLLLASRRLETWHLYVIAVLIGICDAFFYPAATASVPKMVDRAQLPAANALVQTGDQITQIAGPTLAGLLIGWLGLPGAFAINTVFFALGALLLWLVRARSFHTPSTAIQTGGNMLGSMLEGLRYAWRDPAIRVSLFVIGALNFAMVGPMTVGAAALAETRLGGAEAYGVMMAALGLGSLAGTLGAGVVGQARHPGWILAGLAIVLGVSVGLLAFAETFIAVAILMAVMGAGIGFTSVTATAWLQSRTAAQMQGRMMSVLMFAVVIFDPFSQGFAGFMLDVGLAALFLTAGALLLITGFVTIGSRAIRAETEVIDMRAVFKDSVTESQE